MTQLKAIPKHAVIQGRLNSAGARRADLGGPKAFRRLTLSWYRTDQRGFWQHSTAREFLLQ